MFDLTKDKLEEYFFDRCTPQEQMYVQQWFTQNEGTPQAEKLLSDMYYSLNVSDPTQAESAFAKFCQKIGYTKISAQSSRKNGLQRLINTTQRIAAILLLPALILSIYLLSESNNAAEWIEVSVPYGQTQHITLPDNTSIWLNSGSRIIYPSRFDSPNRKIFVYGEIFAQVSSDPQHPFIIGSGDVSVQVLGTTFNMRAYSEDSAVEVVLLEGAVQFGAQAGDHEQQIVLHGGELVQYDRKTGYLDKQRFSTEQYKSFAQGGGLQFFNQPLRDIAAQLERIFNVQIVILNETLAREQYFAYFTNNETVEQMLEVINADNSMKITRKEGVIFIDK